MAAKDKQKDEGFSFDSLTKDLDFADLALTYVLPWAGYIVLGIAVAVVGYLSWRTSQENQETGTHTPTLVSRIGAAISFQVKENPTPLLGPIAFSTYRNVLIAGVLICIPLAWPLNWNIPIAVIVIALIAVAWRRYSIVTASREHTLNQLFTIAQACLRYGKGADLVKDQYVQITAWNDAVIPHSAVVMYPPSAPVSKDEFRQEFELHVTSQGFAGVIWDFEWEFTNNRVLMTAQPPLPTMAYLPFPTVGEFEWDQIPLGIGINGEPITWQPNKAPHMAVSGRSGQGKSVMQRNIMLHCLQSDAWVVLGIDPKRTELSMYKDADALIKYATTEESMNEALEFALEEMNNRYTLMEQEGVAFYRKLPSPPRAMLVMIDEAASLLLETGDREVDILKKRNKVIVGRLAREGRAAGVHVVLATQRPDAKWLGGDTRETIEARVAMGNMSSSASLMILNNVMATRTPGIRGRGIYFDGNEYHPMQSYFFDDSDIAQAIPLCNQLRDGSMDPTVLRGMLYPDGNEEGVADMFGAPDEGGLLGRIRSAFSKVGQRMQSMQSDADPDDDLDDDMSGLTLRDWWAERKAKRAAANDDQDDHIVAEPGDDPYDGLDDYHDLDDIDPEGYAFDEAAILEAIGVVGEPVDAGAHSPVEPSDPDPLDKDQTEALAVVEVAPEAEAQPTEAPSTEPAASDTPAPSAEAQEEPAPVPLGQGRAAKKAEQVKPADPSPLPEPRAQRAPADRRPNLNAPQLSDLGPRQGGLEAAPPPKRGKREWLKDTEVAEVDELLEQMKAADQQRESD